MDCIFCKIISGKIPTKLLSQTSSSISFLDAFPLAKGHVLVIPKNHHQKIQDLTPEENTDLFSLVHQMTSKIDSAGTIHSMFDSSLTLSKDEVEELYNKLKI